MTDTPSPAEREPTRAEALLATLESLVKFDIRTLFDENSSLLPVAAWPPDAALAVAAITSRELFVGSGADRKLIGVEHRVKFNDRSKSLELSMKQMGLFNEPGQQLAAPRPLTEMTDAELEALAVETDAAEDRRWALMSDSELDERLAHFQVLHNKFRKLNSTGLIALLIDGRALDPSTGAVLDMSTPPAPPEATERDVPAEAAAVAPEATSTPLAAQSDPQRFYGIDELDITVPPRDPWADILRRARAGHVKCFF